MSFDFISSPHNTLVKHTKKIIDSYSYRKKQKQTLLEGKTLILDYANLYGLNNVYLLMSKTSYEKGMGDFFQQYSGGKVSIVKDSLFSRFATQENLQGICAVVPLPSDCFDLEVSQIKRAILVDGVQDPGNLGAIMRLAAGFAVDGVILSKNCADVWSPKCLRGAMGAQFLIKNTRCDLLMFLHEFKGNKVGLSVTKGQNINNCHLKSPAVFIVGAEGRGLSQRLEPAIDLHIHIPLSNGVESLNVSSSLAICLYHFSGMV